MYIVNMGSIQNNTLVIIKIAKLLKNSNKTVSFEVLADDYENMKRQAIKISKWGKNIYVKVPVINSKGEFQGKLIKFLNKKKN